MDFKIFALFPLPIAAIVADGIFIYLKIRKKDVNDSAMLFLLPISLLAAMGVVLMTFEVLLVSQLDGKLNANTDPMTEVIELERKDGGYFKFLSNSSNLLLHVKSDGTTPDELLVPLSEIKAVDYQRNTAECQRLYHRAELFGWLYMDSSYYKIILPPMEDYKVVEIITE